MRAVAARSTFPSQKCTKHTVLGPLLEVDTSKKCALLWREAVKKCTKHTVLGPLLEVDTSKKCALLWREAHFQVKMQKTPHVRTTFGRSDVVLRGRRRGLCTLSKVRKGQGFAAVSKTMAGMGHLKRICKDGFRVAGAVPETIRDVRRSGR